MTTPDHGWTLWSLKTIKLSINDQKLFRNTESSWLQNFYRGVRLDPNFYSGSYLFWYLFRPQQKSNHYRHPNFDLYLGLTWKMKPLQSTPNLEDKILKNIIRNMFSIPSKIMVSILSNIIINRRFEIIQRTYQIKIEVSRKSFLIFQNHWIFRKFNEVEFRGPQRKSAVRPVRVLFARSSLFTIKV